MKKNFLFAVVFVSGIFLFSCSENKNSDDNLPEEEPAEFSIDTNAAAGGDTISAPLDSLGVKQTRKDNTSTDTKGNNKKAAE